VIDYPVPPPRVKLDVVAGQHVEKHSGSRFIERPPRFSGDMPVCQLIKPDSPSGSGAVPPDGTVCNTRAAPRRSKRPQQTKPAAACC
jgi:hypothetical protein